MNMNHSGAPPRLFLAFPSSSHAIATSHLPWRLGLLLVILLSSGNNSSNNWGTMNGLVAVSATQQPSPFPSTAPSIMSKTTQTPSALPSASPTNFLRSDTYEFLQTFVRSNEEIDQQGRFDEVQKPIFEEIIVNYTETFADADMVTTVCEILGQSVSTAGRLYADEDDLGDAIMPNGTVVVLDGLEGSHRRRGVRRRKHKKMKSNDDQHFESSNRKLDETPVVTQLLEVNYIITYSSRTVDVSNYHRDFIILMNSNLTAFADILNSNNLLVDSAGITLWELPAPSAAPTISAAPTFSFKTSKFEFSQPLIRSTSDKLNATEQTAFEKIIRDYTPLYGTDPVTTTVKLDAQQALVNNATTFKLELTYFITYESREVESSSYGTAFQTFMNNQLSSFAGNLRAAGISLIEAGEVFIVVKVPTALPTAGPSISIASPSESPFMPSTMPTSSPTFEPKTFNFRHILYRPKENLDFTADENLIFGEAISNMTALYGELIGPPTINTTCEIYNQILLGGRNSNEVELQLDYRIEYVSRVIDTTGYDEAFVDYMNNPTVMTEFNQTLNDLGIVINEVDGVKIIVPIVPEPTPSPSEVVSSIPTISAFPTFAGNPQEQSNLFKLSLDRSGDNKLLSEDDETAIFESIVEGMTQNYGSFAVDTTCEITKQEVLITRLLSGVTNTDDASNNADDDAVVTSSLTLDFTVKWTSKAFDVSGYGDRFRIYMNNDGGRDIMFQELNAQNIIVDSVGNVGKVATTAPPVISPTEFPSMSPSATPSISPSHAPTGTLSPTSSLHPTTRPSMNPSQQQNGEPSSNDNTTMMVVIGVAAGAVAIVATLGAVFWNKRRNRLRKAEAEARNNNSRSLAAHMIETPPSVTQTQTQTSTPAVVAVPVSVMLNNNNNKGHRKKPSSSSYNSAGHDEQQHHNRADSSSMNHSQASDDLISSTRSFGGGNESLNGDSVAGTATGATVPSPIKFMELPSGPSNGAVAENYDANDLTYIQEVPDESMLSQESLLSDGAMKNVNGAAMDSSYNDDDDESGDDVRYRNSLMDEFDMYKDQNLERMRDFVDEKISNSDDMMSEALTKALMDDEEMQKSVDLLWGSYGGSMEVEASVLCDTFDWLKRNDRPGIDDRRLFMQLTMNKMVAGVRYNIIGPEDASRTIHGCATLLGLELVDDLPETTIIITGMPKTTDTDHLINVFKEYGEISDAAMASKMRGFGLVRYRWSKSVKQVMETHRNDEIVVQDVAVTVRVLRTDKNKNDEL
mmetsp:Transcript_14099/g.21632  ORF Transcript_14099/g.21632 Transcript_14099/m.21632 type:complete len:1255 (+) Transcript_14099:131-3895(+)